jgi:hypothetical protein
MASEVKGWEQLFYVRWGPSHVLGNGAHGLMGIFALGHPVAILVAEPDLGHPAAGLGGCGELCQA